MLGYISLECWAIRFTSVLVNNLLQKLLRDLELIDGGGEGVLGVEGTCLGHNLKAEQHCWLHT